MGVVIKKIISWLLIVAGAIEAVWGLLQVYGYEPSNHSLYALTGSFYNPGPYSGFLAMCLPLALHEWLAGKRIGKHLSLVALVLMLFTELQPFWVFTIAFVSGCGTVFLTTWLAVRRNQEKTRRELK